MSSLVTDFDSINQTLYGRELSGIDEGEKAYKLMLSNTTASIVDHMNDRFHSILKDPVLKAACIFEHVRWPSFGTNRLKLESYGEAEVNTLLETTTRRSMATSVATQLKRARSGGGLSSSLGAQIPSSPSPTLSCTSASSIKRATSSSPQLTAQLPTSSTTSPSTTYSFSSPSS